jgi:hypothetical protein
MDRDDLLGTGVVIGLVVVLLIGVFLGSWIEGMDKETHESIIEHGSVFSPFRKK